MHVIHEAFGPNANLYEIPHLDQSSVVIDQAGLRKAYYKTALMYHPDKNQNNNAMAVRKFQAVTAAYQILQDTDKRQIYDETGEFGGLDDDDDDIGGTSSSDSNNPWKDYFDRIFGRVTVDGIAEFEQSYKCSDEEKAHVLAQYENTKGNLVKMLDYVMLSTPRDAERWVEDYLRPAFAAGTITDQYQSTMEKTHKKLQTKIQKEEQEEEKLQPPRRRQDDDDNEQTESDDDTSSSSSAAAGGNKEPPETTSSSRKKKQPPKKPPAANSQKRKQAAGGEDNINKKKKKNDMSSLIAQIQNKKTTKRGGGNSMADFAARYGVFDEAADQQDPLADDDAFRRARDHVDSNRNKKNTTKKPQQQQRKRK
jgi:DnaJ homolog subfamily C member 9